MPLHTSSCRVETAAPRSSFGRARLVIWALDGTAKLSDITPAPDQALNANWSLVATLDYNGDGWRDFLWHNESSGEIVTWYMDGAVVRISGQFATPSQAGNLNWKVVAGGEFSGNNVAASPPGASDIIWRNETTGKLVVWHMDHASTRVLGQFTNPAAPAQALEWSVVGPR